MCSSFVSVVDGLEQTELSSIRGFGEAVYGAEISFSCVFYEWMAVLSTLLAPSPTFIDSCTFSWLFCSLSIFLVYWEFSIKKIREREREREFMIFYLWILIFYIPLDHIYNNYTYEMLWKWKVFTGIALLWHICTQAHWLVYIKIGLNLLHTSCTHIQLLFGVCKTV